MMGRTAKSPPDYQSHEQFCEFIALFSLLTLLIWQVIGGVESGFQTFQEAFQRLEQPLLQSKEEEAG